MGTDDYYQLLGVSRGASRDTLRRAFRSRLFGSHPDLNPEDSLAVERTRQVVEAYRALSGPASGSSRDLAPSPGPREAAIVRREPIISSEDATRMLALVCLLAAMIYLVLGAVHCVSGGSTPVFRPDPSALANLVDFKPLPLVMEPGLQDCVQWYQARQYQLSLAGDWVAQETIRAYELAARSAAMRKDTAAAQFYKAATQHMRREATRRTADPDACLCAL